MLPSSPAPPSGRKGFAQRLGVASAIAVASFVACSDRTPTGPSPARERTLSSEAAAISSPRRAAPRAVPVRTGNDASLQNWGGSGVALMVDSAGGHLQFECARGTMAPVSLGSGTEFTVAGTWEFETSVVRSDLFPQIFPARYDGMVEGETLILTATVVSTGTDSPQVFGPFTLVRGRFARLRLCSGSR